MASEMNAHCCTVSTSIGGPAKADLAQEPITADLNSASVKNSGAAKKCWQKDVSSAPFTLPA